MSAIPMTSSCLWRFFPSECTAFQLPLALLFQGGGAPADCFAASVPRARKKVLLVLLLLLLLLPLLNAVQAAPH